MIHMLNMYELFMQNKFKIGEFNRNIYVESMEKFI